MKTVWVEFQIVTQNVYEQIYFIQKIIEEGDGDTGRLNFIKECLENQKSLFKSDRKYLEGKLNKENLSLNDIKSEKIRVLNFLKQEKSELKNIV